MSKNLIPEIARMLGVEIGEEFKIKGYDGLTYKLTDNGLELTTVDGQKTKWFDHGALNCLLKGKMEIVKLPWKPKFADRYFGFFKFNGKLRITRYDIWRGTVEEEAQYRCGWIFRTREEAEAALPAVAKGLDVEYEL